MVVERTSCYFLRFTLWIAAEFEMHEQSARRLMQVADTYAGKSNIVLGLNATALYELAAPSTPQSIREDADLLKSEDIRPDANLR
ncbi:hypothetical protein J2T08_002954 [Neorhizobium galegae]|uniref:hypothetical protein n=1 Tax=Neorhizobium galegae TaxID=399 RepID=UPI0027879185|nr:hypothetical protein [Neorhizobium galegae]MDQ0135033.1 hypothetical protein [Neorhizobium galegae]